MQAGMLIETGIKKLDEILGGGVRKGSSILFLSAPGLDPSIFLFQTLYNNLAAERTCIFYVDDKFPAAIKELVGGIKLWERKRFDKTIFVDGFAQKTGIPSSEKYAVKEADIKDIAKTIERAMKENRDELLLFYGGYENAVLSHSADKALTLLDELLASSIALHASTIISLVNWDFSESFLEEVKKRFDVVVRIDAVEEKFLMRNYFHVEKAPAAFVKLFVPYRIGLDGIGIYVPKIVVTGPFHSGKSSFIQKISTRAVSIDRMGTTIALDHGYVDYGGVGADLFGTPGQERFEFMLDILKRDTFGVILLVDSTDPETFERGMDMLQHIGKEAIPYVIAANKQDIPRALTPDEIKKRMGLPPDIPVIGTSALTGEGCLDAVKALIGLVITKNTKKT